MNCENCFAYIREGFCLALKKQDCDECVFYKDKTRAKIEYFKYKRSTKTQYNIEKHYKIL